MASKAQLYSIRVDNEGFFHYLDGPYKGEGAPILLTPEKAQELYGIQEAAEELSRKLEYVFEQYWLSQEKE